MTNIFEAIVVAIFSMAIGAAITGILVMWLWNWLMPGMFGLMEINFLEGWGFAMLSSLLFKDTSKSSKND